MRSHLAFLECARCGARLDPDELHQRCGCGGTLLARYDLSGIELDEIRARPAGLWRYREMLPVRGEPISLGETETPLLYCPRLSQRWDVEVHVKDDGPLPGSTFKARGAAVALSRAVELGVKEVVMPTAGNAGGAWAQYAARAGIDITVTMATSAPLTNQSEVRAAGGELVLVEGTIADAAIKAATLATERGAFLAATYSEPYRLEGKKSAWLEVFDARGAGRMRLPGTIVLPVGGGVALVAAAKAAEEVIALGWTDDPPPMLVGVQPTDCAPIVRAFEAGEEEVVPWPEEPTTIASGLRVPVPAEGALVLKRVRESGGAMAAVSEDEIVGSIVELASSEGIFACPEGATTIAAAARLAGELRPPVVLYNTAAGAKYSAALAGRL